MKHNAENASGVATLGRSTKGLAFELTTQDRDMIHDLPFEDVHVRSGAGIVQTSVSP
jgi:hypothetical protein